jgi:hypothetical protein
MATYAEKLKDPRWQKVRLEILNRDEWRCQVCDDETTCLIVHHKRYVRGREPWEYELRLLITLCEKCHDKFHEDKKPPYTNKRAQQKIIELATTQQVAQRLVANAIPPPRPAPEKSPSLSALSKVRQEVQDRKNRSESQEEVLPSSFGQSALSKIREEIRNRNRAGEGQANG